MTEQLALTERPAEIQVLSPMQMLQAAFQSAIDKGAGLEVVDRILKQQRDMIEYQDRVTFNDALARVQAKAKRVAYDRSNTQTNSKYATFAALDNVMRPLYIGEGLSLSFDTADIEKLDMVRVVCDVSLGGYTKRYHIDMPADGKGAKGGDVMTRTHATGSAVSYGKRYLLVMIFNLTVGEQEDDGNAASGRRAQMNDEAYITHQDNIENAVSLDELHKCYLAAVKAAKAIGDQGAESAFIKMKDARKQAFK